MTDYTKILPKGKRNAILAPDLAQRLGFRSTRQLRADISKSRSDGQIIYSSTSGGYYIPETREEIQGFIRTGYTKVGQRLPKS